MAKKAKTSSTTKTTKVVTSSSRKRPTTITTKTTTTRSTSPQKATRVRAPAPKKKGSGWGTLAFVLIVLIILIAGVYLLTSQPLNLSQQRGQFENQLGIMQNNNQNLTLFYLSNAPNYKLDINQSWSVQASDKDANGSIVGQVTISWNGKSRTLSIQDGIVTTGISPTYAVTLSHPQFMSLSQDIITRNTAGAFAYYTTYYLTGKINYTRVS